MGAIVKMKKELLTLLFGASVIVGAFSYETNKFEFIPKGADVMMYDIDKNGVVDFYWWDKNKDNIMTPEEIFIDLNQDGIPDISYKELIRMYENERPRGMHI